MIGIAFKFVEPGKMGLSLFGCLGSLGVAIKIELVGFGVGVRLSAAEEVPVCVAVWVG